MKALIIFSHLEVGGTEKLTVQLINEFIEQGHDCRIFVIREKGRTMLDFLNKEVLVIYGNKQKESDFRYLGKLKTAVNDFKPDSILCTSNFSYLSLKLASPFKKTAPAILAIHYTFKYGIKNKILNNILFYILKRSSDRIIAIYKSQIDIFSKRHRIPLHKFSLVHNGVDISYYNPENASETKDADFTICHIANYRKEKDQWTLFKALKILNSEFNSWQLIFCGRIPAETKEEFVGFLDENGMTNKVTFVDYESDVRKPLRISDVFALSSISEALPLTAIEAMAMHVPCIMTDVGGCSDIIDDGINGYLVPERSPEKLAEKMLVFANNPMLLKKMRTEARKKAEKNFDIVIAAKKYLNVLSGKENNIENK